MLSAALKSQRAYATTRDIPAIPTSGLSQYIKFGIVSIRKVYHLFRKNKEFIRQLYWRDFYFQIAFYKPTVLAKPGTVNRNYYEKYSKLKKYTHLRTVTVKKKPGGEASFKAWCTGNTPEPLVNAGIRELLTTGRMHNRLRMIVASYLIKDLGWSWEDGEKFFANHLIDYDPAVNNGNWQFINGSGASAMMLSRKFSPERQAKQYDPDGLYIHKYIKN
jgi:deoxyribodipyrimidine photo-lyase